MPSSFAERTPLPESWVQRIFARLSVVYGRDFLSRWEGQDLSIVMADWGRELAGFDANPAAIAHALEHLPADKAPNALQFRSLCLGAPVAQPPRLAAPAPSADNVARLRELAEKLRTAMSTDGKGPAATARRLREIAREKPLTEAQKRALAECERQDEPTAVVGRFHPIAEHLLPPGMRQSGAQP